ncbi:MAG: ScyD/ScyE family protein [Xanthomonadales bacterium]|nr:ScyD/ScyE family protein [Xanthomonadales bacterium]
MMRKTVLLSLILVLGSTMSVLAGESYSLDPPVFDIATTPNGSIIVSQGASVSEIKNGQMRFINDVPVLPNQNVNGLATQGSGNIFATTSSPDLALGAGVWRVDRDEVVLLADIEMFETQYDPDAFEGLMWKDQRCEFLPGVFSEGPQSNPYHLITNRGNIYVADAAGNTVLTAGRDGELDWLAIMTPPLDPGGEFMVLFTLPDGTDCYVQPVPTAVAMDDDGDLFVGELTGVPSIPGLSRVWRIDAGARNVVCPSDRCTLVIEGMTSIIDLAFGPDGMLYVVEFDEAGWLAATGGGAVGGTVNRCNTSTGSCSEVASGLFFPSAIDFDKRGQLWLLEANVIAPQIRTLDY